MARCDFIELAKDIRSNIKTILEEAADYQITSIEKTPLAKTVCTCHKLLKVEPAMWLFVTTEGVEPTNNAASKKFVLLYGGVPVLALTPLAGSTFFARMMTVVTSLKSQ